MRRPGQDFTAETEWIAHAQVETLHNLLRDVVLMAALLG